MGSTIRLKNGTLYGGAEAAPNPLAEYLRSLLAASQYGGFGGGGGFGATGSSRPVEPEPTPDWSWSTQPEANAYQQATYQKWVEQTYGGNPPASPRLLTPQAPAPAQPNPYSSILTQAYSNAAAAGEPLPGIAGLIQRGVAAFGEGVEKYQEATTAATLEGLLGNLENLANLRNTALEEAEGSAYSSYGGAISAVSKQIEEAKKRMARDTGIIQGLIDGAEEIYLSVSQNAKKAGAAAGRAIEANSAKAERELATEHRGAEGKVRAIMDLVGASGEEAVFKELTGDLDEAFQFIGEGLALTAEGQAAMVDQAQRMAVTAGRATEATMQSEYGRNLDSTITQFNGILKNLFERRAALYAARARAVAAAREAVYQKFGQDAPSTPEGFAQAALSYYVESNGQIDRRDQQVVGDVLWGMDQMNVDLTTFLTVQAEGMSDDPAIQANIIAGLEGQLEPYYDVILQGRGIIQGAYDSWEATIATPYDTDMTWWDRNVIISDIANQGYASDSERLSLINNMGVDPRELVSSIPSYSGVPTTAPDYSTLFQGLGGW